MSEKTHRPDPAEMATRLAGLRQQSRAAARRLAEVEVEENLAEVEDQVADTHEKLAVQRGDPAYQERADKARWAAAEARRVAARERVE
jgi:hypothetical protein